MPNKTLDLTKIKLGKSMVELVYMDFVTAGDDTYTKEVSEKCKAPATADFRAAVSKLKKFVYKVHPLEKDQVESLEVTQITIKPEDDGMGITLAVTAQFKNVSRPSNFNTPYASTLDNSNPLPDSVVELIDVIKDQAKLYSEGVYEQVTLDLDDTPTKETVYTPSEEDGSQTWDGAENKDGVSDENPKRKRRTKLEMERDRAEAEESTA